MTGANSRSLQIAILSTCALSTPPRRYGGTELVVAELARELRNLGHQPTVFATGDSTCVGAQGCLFPHPVWPPDRLAELRHASAAWMQVALLDEFDIVHVNDAEAVPFTSFVAVPTVATVHHAREEALCNHYTTYPDVAFVAISRRQAELSWEVPFRTVIHHGLDIEQYPLGSGGRGAAFLGRFAPEKGPHIAIEVARRAHAPIRLGGEAHPSAMDYFKREIAPRLGGGAEWIGEVDHAGKLELLCNACCLLFPIQWEEPFGLVMIEAMLVGTPVVAFACGAASEIVEDGVTGFLVHTVDEMCQGLHAARRIERSVCRARARERWSSARMAREYEALYVEVIEHWSTQRSRYTVPRPSGHRGENGRGVIPFRR